MKKTGSDSFDIAAIGALQDAMALPHGHAGTTITASIYRIEWYER